MHTLAQDGYLDLVMVSDDGTGEESQESSVHDSFVSFHSGNFGPEMTDKCS